MLALYLSARFSFILYLPLTLHLARLVGKSLHQSYTLFPRGTDTYSCSGLQRLARLTRSSLIGHEEAPAAFGSRLEEAIAIRLEAILVTKGKATKSKDATNGALLAIATCSKKLLGRRRHH